MVQYRSILHKALKEHLQPYGYAPGEITQRHYIHKHRDINFILVVDEFGIKYRNKKDVDHLISAL